MNNEKTVETTAITVGLLKEMLEEYDDDIEVVIDHCELGYHVVSDVTNPHDEQLDVQYVSINIAH